MHKLNNLKILVITFLFSLLLVSVCLAASKMLPSQDAATTSISQDIPKVPDKIENSEAERFVSQKIVETYKEVILNEPLLVIVDKFEYKLYLFKDGKKIKSYNVAVGKNSGQKQRAGDMTTPTGYFTVDEVIACSDWTHDFNDGNGEIVGAYGPWFISLETGWDGIGIHGTHNPSSIGTMASEGCLRMNNEEVIELKGLISVGTKVIVVE